MVTPQSGSGSIGSGGVAVGDGNVVINKLDLMSMLSEQNVTATNTTKLLLSQHTEFKIAQNLVPWPLLEKASRKNLSNLIVEYQMLKLTMTHKWFTWDATTLAVGTG